MATKVWLTYAWKDNGDRNIDFIIQELEARGLDVGYDRAKLLAGQRLWDQIDAHISAPDLDAWIIHVTQNSLQSEPCQEELAYALDRTLRTKHAKFPLIGLFPEPLDRALIPSAIATRLYVTLQDNSWADQIVAAATATPQSTRQDAFSPIAYQWHKFKDQDVLEVWPRVGQWAPFYVAVKAFEAEKLGSVMPGTRGYVTGSAMIHAQSMPHDDFKIEGMQNAVSASSPAHIFFSDRPSELVIIGYRDGKQEQYPLSALPPQSAG